MVYIVWFFLSTVLVAVSESADRRKKKICALVLGTGAVMILTVMAGIRDYEVGTDIDYYILPQYYHAQKYAASFRELLNHNVKDMEFLFLAVEYISMKIFHTPHFAMLFLSLLTNGFIYIGIIKQRGRMSVSFAWLTYCFFYYNVSLNLMRQSVSVAVLFYLFSDLKRLNWKRVAFFSVLAGLFHISGFLGLFLYAAYLLICRRNRISGLQQILFAFFLLLPVLIPIGVRLLIAFIGLNQRYFIYNDNQGSITIGNLIFRILCLTSYAILWYRNVRNSRKAHANTNTDTDQSYFLLYAGIMNVMFVLNNSAVLMRLRHYFDIFILMYLPMGLRLYSRKKGLRAAVSLAFLAAVIVYWYYIFVFLGNGETVPYHIDPDWMKSF